MKTAALLLIGAILASGIVFRLMRWADDVEEWDSGS